VTAPGSIGQYPIKVHPLAQAPDLAPWTKSGQIAQSPLSVNILETTAASSLPPISGRSSPKTILPLKADGLEPLLEFPLIPQPGDLMHISLFG
jgi:hypothetical protein